MGALPTKVSLENSSFCRSEKFSKWKNVDSNGNQGSDSAGNFVDTDIPLIRLAEIYLNYAEATLRGGGGDTERLPVNMLLMRLFVGSLLGGPWP